MKDQIREQLVRLRHEIDALPDDQQATRQELDEIVSEIEGSVDQEDADHGGLVERIRRTIETFEVEHPQATSILNEISNKLASMGI